MELECNKSAQGGTNYCKAHGGRMLEYHLFLFVFAVKIMVTF